MNLYYHRGREGQESYAPVSVEVAQNDGCKNESFATFPTPANEARSPLFQGVSAAREDEGLVYATKHTNPPKPTYLTLVAAKVEEIATNQAVSPPRGKHAKNSIKAGRAVHKKTKGWFRLLPDDRERRVLDFAFRSESIAFTVNLTPKKQVQIQKEDRPAKALADAINRASRRLLGRTVPISLALEVSPTGRLHAHGIATLERGEWKSFRDALKSAGGKIDGFGAGRQTDTRRLWRAAGWAAYIAKDFDRTAQALGTDKIFYQCNATRAGAREEYEASLARQKAHRRTQGGPSSAS